MVHGLPVVCLDLGGPGVMVDRSSGIVIGTAERSSDEVIEDLKNALCRLAEDDELRRSLSDGARRRVEDFRWEKLVRTVYSDGCLPQNRDAGK